jgi:hypothetical protein
MLLLLEELLVNLVGPAVARLILTRWLQNPDLAEEVTGSLYDEP